MNTTLLFIEGRQTTSYYDTPFGSIMMGVTTETINVDMNENGGKVSAKYNIRMNGMFSGANTLEIHVRKI